MVTDTAGSLVLLQSRLDNSFILGGCISEADIHKSDLHRVPSVPQSYVNRIAVDNMPPLIDDQLEDIPDYGKGYHGDTQEDN